MSESDKQEPGFVSDAERAANAVAAEGAPKAPMQTAAAGDDFDGPPGVMELPRDSSGDAAMKASSSKVFALARLIERTQATRAGFREFTGILNTVRAPLFVALLGLLAFAIPGQVHEIYRLYAEDFTRHDWNSVANIRIASFFVMLHLTGYSLWFIARVLTLTDKTALSALTQWDLDGVAARWAPRLIGAAPAFGAAYGMAIAESGRNSALETPLLYVGAAIAFMIGILRIWMSWRRSRVDRDCYDNLKRTWFRTDVRLILSFVLIALFVYLMTQPVVFAQLVGALSIFCFFMIALVFGWAQLTYLYDRYAIPALTILVGAALTFSLLDLNDNHFYRERGLTKQEKAVEQLKTQAAAFDIGPAIPLTIENAFADWYESRADREAYEKADKPYPVYVVAAQGGGLYAAYQSAMFMAKLQDLCPSFANHVFAMSGVSGGAVGSTIFTALSHEYARNVAPPVVNATEGGGNSLDSAVIGGGASLGGVSCGERPVDEDGAPISFEAKTDAMLRQDFLSPLVSGLLFGDFTAQFSPVPIPMFDRARALERAFELSWRASLEAKEPLKPVALAGVGGLGIPSISPIAGQDFLASLRDFDPRLENNPLELGLMQYWSEAGSAPALFLNATEAETGRRMVMTPIEDLGDDMRSYALAAEPGEDGRLPDMRLSTAAIISARFPYVTPAASMPLRPIENADGTFPKIRLVDGGYFENSGIDTALDIIQSVEASERRERREARREGRRAASRVDIRLIVFDLTEDRFRDATYALGELISPVKAILNARVSRSTLAQSRARRALRSPCRYIYLGGAKLPGASDEDAESRLCLPSQIAASRVWSVSLNDYEYDFQLGWILSRQTLDSIRSQLGDPRTCSPGAPRVQSVSTEQAAAPLSNPSLEALNDAVARHNSCIGAFVLEQLKP